MPLFNQGYIVAVIPTYNEADNIPPLITTLENLDCIDHIIVVDDNSTDGTLPKLSELQQTYGNIVVHKRPRKLGFGTAVKEGFQLALETHPFTRLIQMDADLSHDPTSIPQMLRNKEDIVLGSRYIKQGKIVGWNLYRKLLSRTANVLSRNLLGLKIHDLTTGYRIYSRTAIGLITKNAKCNGYAFEVETLWLSVKNSLTIKEVPITFVERCQGKSKLARVHEVALLIKFVLSHISN